MQFAAEDVLDPAELVTEGRAEVGVLDPVGR